MYTIPYGGKERYDYHNIINARPPCIGACVPCTCSCFVRPSIIRYDVKYIPIRVRGLGVLVNHTRTSWFRQRPPRVPSQTRVALRNVVKRPRSSRFRRRRWLSSGGPVRVVDLARQKNCKNRHGNARTETIRFFRVDAKRLRRKHESHERSASHGCRRSA